MFNIQISAPVDKAAKISIDGNEPTIQPPSLTISYFAEQTFSVELVDYLPEEAKQPAPSGEE